MQIIFYRSQYPAENVVIEALYEGCTEKKQLLNLDQYQPSEVAVVMGVYKKAIPASFPRGLVIKGQKERGLDTLILETGYINRGDGPDNHYALGWNGLNGRADFQNRNSPKDRAEKLNVKLKDWRNGENILLCGQVPWDASCDFIDLKQWLQVIARQIKYYTTKPIVFRPHPKAALPPIQGCQYSTGRPIEEDLKDAQCMVSFNSNSGVDAVLAGVQTLAFDIGSMVWSVSKHEFVEFDYIAKPDRTQWLNDITYAQWTPDEMRSGEAWHHIAKCLYSERLCE